MGVCHPYKILEENKNSYLISSINNKIYQIDNNTKLVLKQEGKYIDEIYDDLSNNMPEEIIDNIINEMRKSDFLKSKKNFDEYNKYLNEFPVDNLSSITLLIIQECNLKCRYCYGEEGVYNNKGKMSLETARQSVDFLINNSSNKNLYLIFFGGEPLLNFSLIKDVVSYSKKREKETDKIFKFSITTNATLLNKEIERFLTDNDFNITISIDGDKYTNDTNRYFDKQVGSYDVIVDKTEYIRKSKKVNARGTITGIQMDLLHTHNHLYDLGFKSIHLSKAVNMLTEEDNIQLINSYNKLIDEFGILLSNKDKKCFSISLIVKSLLRIHNNSICKKVCGAGVNMCAVDIDGNLFPCQRYVNSKEYILGNIYENVFEKERFYNEVKVCNHSKCNSCWVKNLCIGGCTYENLEVTGKTNVASKIYCTTIQAFYERIVRLYIVMTDDDKKFLFSIGNKNT